MKVISDDACFEFVSQNKFVSQYCFFYKLAGERLDFQTSVQEGGVADLANFGVLHGLRVLTTLVFGFRFSSTMMTVFGSFLSRAFYGFSGFAKKVTRRINRGYHTVARRYEFYVQVARAISHNRAQRTNMI